MKDSRYPWLLLIVTSLGVLTVFLNMSSLNVVLPVLSAYFKAGPVATSWILLSYMLVNSILILVFGKMADIYGRRGMYLFGLGLITVVSFCAGFVSNVWMLITLRVLQAVGGALVVTNTTPYITDTFPERDLGTALGINVLVSSASQLIGPVVGGLLVYRFGWRWVFWFNVPLGGLGFILGFFLLKPSRGRTLDERVDILGNLCIFLGMGGLIFALSQSGIVGWDNPMVITGLVFFGVFISLFIFWERRTKYPTIDFSLFRRREYLMANLATFLNTLARSSVVLLIALFFQVMDKENTFAVGVKVLPVTIGMLIASPLAGVLSRRYSTLLLSTSGLVMTGLGMLILAVNMTAHASFSLIGLGQFLVGFGSGVFMTPNTKSIMLTVPVERRGVANGIRSMLQNLGTVISTALSLMVVTSVLPPRLKEAVYDGARADIGGRDFLLISGGFRLAFAVLFGLTLCAVIGSYLRGNDSPNTVEGKNTVTNNKESAMILRREVNDEC